MIEGVSIYRATRFDGRSWIGAWMWKDAMGGEVRTRGYKPCRTRRRSCKKSRKRALCGHWAVGGEVFGRGRRTVYLSAMKSPIEGVNY